MKFLNLSVYRVAAMAELSPRTMTEYLAERLPITPDHLARLSRVLDCEPDDLQAPEVLRP